MKNFVFLLAVALSSLLLCTSLVNAQSSTLDKVAYQYAQRSFQDFYDFLSLPNDAHYPEDIDKNIAWCKQQFEARNFSTKQLKTKRLPLLLATRQVKNADKTILVYLQIDGQPVDSSKWQQESPWKPALKQKTSTNQWQEIPWEKLKSNYHPDYRIFARAASDAKGPAVMFLAALDAVKSLNKAPNYNLKVIMDFEEELGSPNLPAAVQQYKEDLAADAFIIFDGPLHVSNQPTLLFGARGIVTVSLKVFGPRKPQHSGHYGNYAPNPALRLAELLVSMKDTQGKVSIPGWYDGVHLSPAVKKILQQVPDKEATIRKKIGIAHIDRVASSYQESIQYPSLNILGLQSGWTGKETRTIIPATATAEMDIRLVKESDPQKLLSLLQKHIKNQGFHFVKGTPTEAERSKYSKLISFNSRVFYQAFRTDFDTRVGQWLRNAVKKAFGKNPIQIRMSGGSIPISPFVNTLNIPAVGVPTVNPDNNQHSPNENIRVGNYVNGVKTMMYILMERY